MSKYGQIIGFATEAVSPGERIFGMILESASGKQAKREQLGLGDPEFTPWQIGWVMQLPVHLLVPLASQTQGWEEAAKRECLSFLAFCASGR